jgi:hypothetical protein
VGGFDGGRGNRDLVRGLRRGVGILGGDARFGAGYDGLKLLEAEAGIEIRVLQGGKGEFSVRVARFSKDFHFTNLK